jgi:hypothetical protein
MALSVGFGYVGWIALNRRFREKDPSPLADFTAFPIPGVIDDAEALHIRETDAQLFHQLAPYGLLGGLAFLNAAPRRAMD